MLRAVQTVEAFVPKAAQEKQKEGEIEVTSETDEAVSPDAEPAAAGETVDEAAPAKQ